MTQTPPHKPAYMSDEDYDFILDRDGHQCALRDYCNRSGRLGLIEYCDQALDFDHNQPRDLGGDDAFTNIRLLCASENRSRPVQSSDYWAAANYWDGPFAHEKLRRVQYYAGYGPITEIPELRLALTGFRNRLLNTVTLMVGATGTGKAITVFSVFFAINQMVNAHGSGRPRVRHVLWLTHEEQLRDLTQRDLEDDPHNLDLVETKPIARVAQSYTDILRGPCGADIIVACPHSLWFAGDPKKGVRRSTAERKRALAHYDAVVFDECDFADEQAQGIALLASHALKFALTASPPLMGRALAHAANFLTRFVLLSPEAVADYRRAIDYDGCLKDVLPYRGVTVHAGFDELSKGVRQLIADGLADPSHTVYLAAIKEIIVEADRLEQEMAAALPDAWFSPHVIVRLNRIHDIKALLQVLPGVIGGLYDIGRISGVGWGVCAVYQGHQRDCPIDERDLAAKLGGSWRHPFLLARNNPLGRAMLGSKRVLLMINIGLRGLNNWPIQFVLDCTERTSELEGTQLKGRGIRWPNHLSHLWNTESTRRFVAMHTVLPTAVLEAEKIRSLDVSHHFLHEMRTVIGEAGFRTWSDLVAGVTMDAAKPDLDPMALPLTAADKLQLMAGLGAEVTRAEAQGVPVPDLRPKVGELVARLKPEATGKRKERAEEYIARLIAPDPAFRADEVFAENDRRKAKVDPVRVPVHLKPKAHYTIEELIQRVETDPFYANARELYIGRLREGTDQLVFNLVAQRTREDDRVSYREPARQFLLTAARGAPKGVGVLSDIIDELVAALKAANQITQSEYGAVAQAVYEMTADLFGVPNAQNNGPLDQHAYHVEIMGRQRSRIMKMALGVLADRGIVKDIAALGRYR